MQINLVSSSFARDYLKEILCNAPKNQLKISDKILPLCWCILAKVREPYKVRKKIKTRTFMFAGGTEGVPDQVLIVTAVQRTGALRQTLQLWLLLLPWYSWPDTPAHLRSSITLWQRWWWWGVWEVPPCYPGHPSALQLCDPRSKTPGKSGRTVHLHLHYHLGKHLWYYFLLAQWLGNIQ